jgi:hypothetical protein
MFYVRPIKLPNESGGQGVGQGVVEGVEVSMLTGDGTADSSDLV